MKIYPYDDMEVKSRSKINLRPSIAQICKIHICILSDK
jgi:hypothetical protein